MGLDLVVGNGAFAISWGRSTGTHRGDFTGLAPTGRPFDVQTLGILCLLNGQVVERWGMSDNFTMLRQLGSMG